MSTVSVGKRYSSFEELEIDISNFGKVNNTIFWKRDAVTLQRHPRFIKKMECELIQKLKYYLIKYACIAGGRQHKKRPVDGSRRTKTVRQNCPVFISVLLSKDKTALVIKEIILEHNHIVSESIFLTVPPELNRRGKYRKFNRYSSLKVEIPRNADEQLNIFQNTVASEVTISESEVVRETADLQQMLQTNCATSDAGDVVAKAPEVSTTPTLWFLCSTKNTLPAIENGPVRAKKKCEMPNKIQTNKKAAVETSETPKKIQTNKKADTQTKILETLLSLEKKQEEANELSRQQLQCLKIISDCNNSLMSHLTHQSKLLAHVAGADLIEE